jgi:hypothetical protein
MPAHSARNNIFMWLGVALLVAGLSGHLFAAVAIGGHYIAYRDHIFGFVFLTLLAGLISCYSAGAIGEVVTMSRC